MRNKSYLEISQSEVSRLDNKSRRKCLSIWPACCFSHRPLRGRIKHKFPRQAVSVKLDNAVQLQPAEWLHAVVTLRIHLVIIAAILKRIKRKTKDRCPFFLSSFSNRTEITGLLSFKVGVVDLQCNLKDHTTFKQYIQRKSHSKWTEKWRYNPSI